MKTQIFGIFVCILLLTTVAIPGIASNTHTKEPIQSISRNADIPTWEVGDTWTYKMDFYADFGVYDKQTLSGTSDNLVYEVVDDTGDYYKLESKGKFSGYITAAFASIRLTTLSTFKGELLVQKSNLVFIENTFLIKGISMLMAGKIPIPFPIPYQMGMNSQFSPPLSILPFPLYDGKYGNLANSTFNQSGFINLLFGILFEFTEEWSYDARNLPYICNEEEITVEAGSFDAYNVTAGYLTFIIENHYAPEVGNIVKQKIWQSKAEFHDEPYFQLNQELISTTYEP